MNASSPSHIEFGDSPANIDDDNRAICAHTNTSYFYSFDILQTAAVLLSCAITIAHNRYHERTQHISTFCSYSLRTSSYHTTQHHTSFLRVPPGSCHPVLCSHHLLFAAKCNVCVCVMRVCT